jgi:hypothetical protein
MMISALFTISLMVALLAAGVVIHRINMAKFYAKIDGLKVMDISKKDLYEELSIHQGSNFNAALMTAWMLFGVAFVYFYVLTPQISQDISFLKVAPLAGNPLGLAIFAAAVLAVAAVAVTAIDLPRIYSYYEISKREKTATVLAVPLLWASITSSTYLVTVHPPEFTDPVVGVMKVGALAFVPLLASLIILLLPIYERALR